MPEIMNTKQEKYFKHTHTPQGTSYPTEQTSSKENNLLITREDMTTPDIPIRQRIEFGDLWYYSVVFTVNDTFLVGRDDRLTIRQARR